MDIVKPLLIEALTQESNYHFSYSLLGEVYMKEHAFNEAIVYLEQLLSITI